MRLVEEKLVHLIGNPHLDADGDLPHSLFPLYDTGGQRESQFMSTIIDMREKNLPATCYLFKHSTSCPVSARAADEVRAMRTDTPIYWVNVREQRELSNWVAAQYGVTHESPQLILLKDGKVEAVWSHYAISREPKV
jgi:bacillithiol system protein YtxJ